MLVSYGFGHVVCMHLPMKTLILSIRRIFLFLLLTVLTQVGGLSYLASGLCLRWLPMAGLAAWRRRLMRLSVHAGLYLLLSVAVVPSLAARFGRVPLPVFGASSLGPRSLFTAILNRHYVRPAMRALLLDASGRMAVRHPGFRLSYFDANFPFRLGLGPFRAKGFPLLPHLSHSDGRKVDLGFVYRDVNTGVLSRHTPSSIGYGISEEPLPSERNRPRECQDHRMYSLMREVWPQAAKDDYVFDAALTREMIDGLARDARVEKVLLEPHLTTRLRLGSEKVREVQCGSVRHDDHVHVQVW
jgi:hypothetical protein